MYPTTYLEWFHEGAWHRIGWTASTPESHSDLLEHAVALAASKPGFYRLVHPSIYADAPPTVVREWTPTAA